MKKLFTLIVMACLIMPVYGYSHFHHARSFHHVSHSRHSSNKPKMEHYHKTHPHGLTKHHTLAKRTYPIQRQKCDAHYERHLNRMIMFYLLLPKSRHHDDTFLFKDKEYKLCPKCNNRLIKKHQHLCSVCSKH